jgi:hypothetical protein
VEIRVAEASLKQGRCLSRTRPPRDWLRTKQLYLLLFKRAEIICRRYAEAS